MRCAISAPTPSGSSSRVYRRHRVAISISSPSLSITGADTTRPFTRTGPESDARSACPPASRRTSAWKLAAASSSMTSTFESSRPMPVDTRCNDNAECRRRSRRCAATGAFATLRVSPGTVAQKRNSPEPAPIRSPSLSVELPAPSWRPFTVTTASLENGRIATPSADVDTMK